MAGQDENWSQEAKYMELGEFLKDRIWYEKNSRKLSICVKLRPSYTVSVKDSFNLLQMVVNSEINCIM